jgi:hypothetical protein
MQEALQSTILLVKFAKLILLFLGDLTGCQELFWTKQWSVVCQMDQLHLVSDPVVEEIEDEGPDGFELVGVVLVKVC